MTEQAEQRLEWLESISKLLPEELRERFALRIAVLGAINEDDPLYQLLDVLGFVTLALHNSVSAVSSFDASVKQLAPVVAEASQLRDEITAARKEVKNLTSEFSRQVSSFGEEIGRLSRDLKKNLATGGYCVLTWTAITLVSAASFVIGMIIGHVF